MVKNSRRFRHLYILIVVLLLGGGLALWLFGRMSWVQPSFYPRLYPRILPLSGDARLTQTFKARYPGLHQIRVYLARQGDGSASGQIVFRLKKACNDSTDLTILTVPAAEIMPESLYPFTFPPLANSTGQNFCLVLETQQVARSAGLGAYVSIAEAYGAGAATYQPDTTVPPAEGRPATPDEDAAYFVWLPLVWRSQVALTEINQDVGLQLAYRAPVKTMLLALLTSVAQAKPGLLGQPLFYIGLFFVYVGGLVWLGWGLFSDEGAVNL